MDAEDVQNDFPNQRKVVTNAFSFFKDALGREKEKIRNERIGYENEIAARQFDTLVEKIQKLQDDFLLNLYNYLGNVGNNNVKSIWSVKSVLEFYKGDLDKYIQNINDNFKLKLDNQDPIIRELNIITDIQESLDRNYNWTK